MKASVFLFCLFLLGSLAQAELFSVSAGRVGDRIVTSREVMIHHLLEQALSTPIVAAKIRLAKPYDREFVREATGVLVETAVNFEAVSFQAVTISSAELNRERRKVLARLKSDKAWRSLKVEGDELDEALDKKLRAKSFIRFKVESSHIPITDREAKEYFENNRLKFENLPFEQFKDNIKAYLSKQQMDHRLRDWFELLQTKYRVRNYLAE